MFKISGFSKLSKAEKIEWLSKTYLKDAEASIDILKKYWNEDSELQKLHDGFIENSISNFYLPFGIAPNVMVNGKLLAVPMVVEESSVVAAASKAAKFWGEYGGFKAEVLGTKKNGQVYIIYKGKEENLLAFYKKCKPVLLESVKNITANMEKRGGGLLDIELKNHTKKLSGYYALHCTFETLDAMGANFINSCLEQFAKTFISEAENYEGFEKEEIPETIMAILSNNIPECLVRAEVQCPVEAIGKTFAEKFITAIQIAESDPDRAATHNKGIMNGIDAVVIATGNDFRAVEAGAHAYAVRNGSYSSLTHAKIEDNIFKFWIEIPLALGTVGGLTNLHPLVKTALNILQNPSAKELMEITASLGLAQNFAAVKSLITTGIQKGHMKMHLNNILNQLQALEEEKTQIKEYFRNRTITHHAVEEALIILRENKLL